MRTSFAIGCCLVVVAGCDTSGIHALGRLRDTLVPCDGDLLGRVETTSTWLRSTADGTEIILLGRPNATDVVAPGDAACWGHGFVAHDGSTSFAFGSYALDASGKGFALHSVEYVLEQQPERSILKRDGATRKDLPSPISERLSIVPDGSKMLVSLEGETMRMTELGAVVEAIDVHTQAGAEDVFRLFDLPMFTSQARLLGFGSGAMTQYVGGTAEFVGTIRNRFTVSVEALLSPTTHINYYQLEDLSGIVVDGLQTTHADTSGNGEMQGTLNFLMRGTGGPTDVAIRGHMDFSGLKIHDGMAAGGSYALAIDGVAGQYVISYELQTDIDLRDVLPVETP